MPLWLSYIIFSCGNLTGLTIMLVCLNDMLLTCNRFFKFALITCLKIANIIIKSLLINQELSGQGDLNVLLISLKVCFVQFFCLAMTYLSPSAKSGLFFTNKFFFFVEESIRKMFCQQRKYSWTKKNNNNKMRAHKVSFSFTHLSWFDKNLG